MSLFGNIVEGILGDNNEKAAKPCSNCASDCSVFPKACEECQEYKKQLLDQLYYIDHIDDYYAQYEIVGTNAATYASMDCPSCGAGEQTGQFCSFCGTRLREDSGKIKVQGASDIPDPIRLAQDIIFERAEVVEKYSGGSGILGSLISIVTGDDDNNLGSRMSTDEIKEMAEHYGVSVSAYLTGLDNGVYYSLSEMKKQKKNNYAAPAAAGAALFGMGSSRDHRPAQPPHQPQLPHHQPPQPMRHELAQTGRHQTPQPSRFQEQRMRQPERSRFQQPFRSEGPFGRDDRGGHGHGGPGSGPRPNGGKRR